MLEISTKLLTSFLRTKMRSSLGCAVHDNVCGIHSAGGKVPPRSKTKPPHVSQAIEKFFLETNLAISGIGVYNIFVGGVDMALTKEDLQAIGELMDNKLEPINTRLDKIEDGQVRLEARQAKLEDGQVKLEARQARLEARQVKLEDGQVRLEVRQARLEGSQARLEDGQVRLEARQAKLEANQTRLEAKVDEGLAFAKATVDYLGHDVAAIEQRLLDHIDAPIH